MDDWLADYPGPRAAEPPSLVPHTFEETLEKWADILEFDAELAARHPDGAIGMSARDLLEIARTLNGAARMIAQLNGEQR